jgi:sigma-E factor negative regulatory protein RseA
MSDNIETNEAAAERLSALTDGELDAQGTATACAEWRNDESARSRWHSYQLIGDVLRSDDLASTATKDSAFLAALRTRLAEEPVVLAPQPLPVTEHIITPGSVPTLPEVAAKRGWSRFAPAAVAAGFVAVAGALTVSWAPQKSSGIEATLASTPATAQLVSGAASQVSEPQTLVVNGQVIRDPRLDRYLAAHKQFAGAAMLGMPSAFVRSAAAEAPKP